MDNEWKTPTELNVQPGDVVQGRETEKNYTVTQDMRIGSTRVEDCRALYRIVARAAPKLWRDMTREEKAPIALVLLEGGGAVEEMNSGQWTGFPHCLRRVPHPAFAYRVRPEPKRETVVLTGSAQADWVFSANTVHFDTHRLTLPLLDGDLAPGKYTSPEGHNIEVERING